jgi:hypothetical protein
MRITFSAIALAFCLATGTHGATYYVRQSGSDANSGASKSGAFRTITKALSVAKNKDTVWVGAGTYNERVVPVFHGQASNKRLRVIGDTDGAKTGDAGTITVTSSAGASVVQVNTNNFSLQKVSVQGGVDGVRWSGSGGHMASVAITGFSDDGIEMNGGVLVASAVTVTGPGTGSGRGVELNGTTNLNWTNGSISASGGDAVHATGTTTLTMSRARVFGAGDDGLSFIGGTLSLTNCLFYNNIDYQVRCDGGGTVTVRNCTIHGGASSVGLRGVNATLVNNILSTSAKGVHRISASPATNLTHNNNLYWNLTSNSDWSLGPTNVLADPRFVGAATANFDLASGSAAQNAGAAIAGVTVDFANRVRPAFSTFDIGAYERQSTAAALIPYTQTFESTPGSEWSNTTTLFANAALTRSSGRFDNTSQSLRVVTTPGVSYTLVFDLYAWDSWDGDHSSYGPDTFRVSIDGAPIFEETYALNLVDPTFDYSANDVPLRWSTNLGAMGSADLVLPRQVARFVATGSETTITFEGANLQGVNDESWSIDNVRVVATADEAPLVPAFTNAGHLSGWQLPTFSSNPASGWISAPLIWHDFDGNGLPDSMLGGGAGTRFRMNAGADDWIAATAPGASFVAALADYNSDGVVELWRTTNGASLQAYRWNGAGFADHAVASATISGVASAEAIAAGDFDDDGHVDLAILGTTGNRLALNQGADASSNYPGFTMSTSLPGGGTNAGDGNYCSVADANNDGLPDIFYHYNSGRLFLSSGTGTYSAGTSGITIDTTAKVGSCWGDYDNDGDMDLFVGRRGTSNRPYLWRNSGAGASFSDAGVANGLHTLRDVASGDWGDFDNDGDLDLAYTTVAGYSGVMRNDGGPAWTFSSVTLGIETEARGGDVGWIDFDNDANLDLAFSSESTSHWARLFRSVSPASTNTLRVRVQGRGVGGINTAGVGARVELWDAGNTTFLQRRELATARGIGGCNPLWAHFGGVNPSATYTVRVISGGQSYAAQVQPATATTVIGGRTLARFYTFQEAALAPVVEVIRWHEVSAEEAQ